MANKVDVFTEELSKVFTILQQQYVMIKYMKALITSGELDETEINKLKEQVTLMNNKLNRIIDDELVTIKQSIRILDNRINSKVDKVEKTNEWQLYGIGSEQYNLPNGNTINLSYKDIPNTVINRDGSGRAKINTPFDDKDIANKKYVDDTVVSAGGGGKLYRHDLTITNMNDFKIYHTIYATNNTPITTDQIFATVVKANSDYGGQGMYLDSNINIQNALIRYSGGKVIVQTSNGGLAPAKSITDTVTPV